jgi:hypothetical protein
VLEELGDLDSRLVGAAKLGEGCGGYRPRLVLRPYAAGASPAERGFRTDDVA